MLFGPEVGPDHSSLLHHWIGPQVNLFLDIEFWELVWHIDAIPVDVVLPTMEDAAEPIVFVPPNKEGSPSVGTELVEHANRSAGIPKRDEVLAQQPHSPRRAVRLELPGQERRHP